MEKPISLKIESVKGQIINLINSSGLPAYILEPTIKNIYTEILEVKNKEIEISRKQYEESLREQMKPVKKQKNKEAEDEKD